MIKIKADNTARKVWQPTNTLAKSTPCKDRSKSSSPNGDTKRNRRKRSVSPRKNNNVVNAYDFQAQMCSEHMRRAVALDCEMVGTGPNGQTSALARVSVVDWYGRTLLDTHVKVHVPVTDLRTFVSGIRKEDIDPASPHAMEYEQCVHLVRRLIHGRILVGHALENDLQVLKISHPWYAIRDTAAYEPFMRAQGDVLLPRKLKELAYEKLGLVIQNSCNGHSSMEDAWAAMKLYHLAWAHWEHLTGYKMGLAYELAAKGSKVASLSEGNSGGKFQSTTNLARAVPCS